VCVFGVDNCDIVIDNPAEMGSGFAIFAIILVDKSQPGTYNRYDMTKGTPIGGSCGKFIKEQLK
jgi:hypothetical protein